MKSSYEKWGRVILGVFLILYASNHFLHIVPTSYGKMPEITRHFLDSILVFLPFLYFFEMIIGVCLILNQWTKLILIILIPLSISFLMFNTLNMNISMFWPALIVAGLNIWLLWLHRETYKVMLN